jgi:hypothetical protein
MTDEGLMGRGRSEQVKQESSEKKREETKRTIQRIMDWHNEPKGVKHGQFA